jgi:hypothetical protein
MCQNDTFRRKRKTGNQYRAAKQRTPMFSKIWSVSSVKKLFSFHALGKLVFSRTFCSLDV